MQILLPRTDAPTYDLPIVYLAGPILGGGDWQAQMCLSLQEAMGDQDFLIVNPSRWPADHQLGNHVVGLPSSAYTRQKDWEHPHMNRAGQTHYNKSCLLFWLGGQKTPRDDGDYAQDTRVELGEWREKMNHYETRLVWGLEDDFPNIDSIVHDFKLKVGYIPTFHRSIDDMAQAVAEMIQP